MTSENMDTQMNATAEMVTKETSDSIVCGICWQPYSKNVAFPVTLRCGHTFCKPCLAAIYRTQGSIHCASCRAKVYTNHKILRKNLQFVEVLEKHGYLREDPPEEPEPVPEPNRNHRERITEDLIGGFLDTMGMGIDRMQDFVDGDDEMMLPQAARLVFVGRRSETPNQNGELDQAAGIPEQTQAEGIALQVQPGGVPLQVQAGGIPLQVQAEVPQHTQADNQQAIAQAVMNQILGNGLPVPRFRAPGATRAFLSIADYRRILGSEQDQYLPPMRQRVNAHLPNVNGENGEQPAANNDIGNAPNVGNDDAPAPNVNAENQPAQVPTHPPINIAPPSPEVMAEIEGILANIREMGEPIADALNELRGIANNFEGDIRPFNSRLRAVTNRVTDDIQTHVVLREVDRIHRRQRLLRHPELAASEEARRRQIEEEEVRLAEIDEVELALMRVDGAHGGVERHQRFMDVEDELSMQRILWEQFRQQRGPDGNNDQGGVMNQDGQVALDEARSLDDHPHERDDGTMTALEIGVARTSERDSSDDEMDSDEMDASGFTEYM